MSAWTALHVGAVLRETWCCANVACGELFLGCGFNSRLRTHFFLAELYLTGECLLLGEPELSVLDSHDRSQLLDIGVE